MSERQTPPSSKGSSQRTPPFAILSGTSGVDREKAQRVIGHLTQISRYAGDFHDAVALFDMASRKFTECYKVDGPGDPTQILLFASWKQIAARDGAMTIFHFAKSLDALKQAVSDSPALREKIDHTAFREARRAFRDRFKDFEPIRHAVAHSAELTKTPKDKESNSFSGSYASNGIHLTEVNMMISDTLINRTFTNTHEGKIVSYEISWENWKVLDRVVGNVFSLFPER